MLTNRTTQQQLSNGKAKIIAIPYSPRYPEVHETLMQKRFGVLVAHRRFGKTVLAINHLIRMATQCKLIGGHYGYIAPFRNQAKSVAWDYLKYYTKVFKKRQVNVSELSITIPSANGKAKIRIFGADNPDALRGLYFDGVVMDEVAQMKPEVWEEIVQPALADRKGFAVFIGTPKGINLFSNLYFYAASEQAKGSKDWAAMIYPCSKTNALPDDEVERLKNELSENAFRQEMLCDFTASADDVLINLDDVNKAFLRIPDENLAANWPLVVGVDVARFGDDATVFFPRRGLMALRPLVLRKHSNTDVAMRLIEFINEYSPAYVNIDQGQGTGVIDIVRDVAGRRCVINEVPFGANAAKDSKYVNKRSEMWDAIREWLKAGGCLPNDGAFVNILKSELTAPCYEFDVKGRIKLEPKDEIKKRLGHSTDLGDALALTFAFPVTANNINPELRRRPRKIYDPFNEFF